MQNKWAKGYEIEIDKVRLVKNFKNGNLSDNELIFLLSQITRYIRRCHTMLSSEADDIASEAVFEAYKDIDSLQDEAKFIPWVKGIARYIALKQLKQARQMSVCSRDAALGYTNEGSPEEVKALQEQAGSDDEAWLRTMALADAYASLSEEQKAVITLRIDEQRSYQAIAKQLDKPESNVRQIEFRACLKMYKYLVSGGYADMFPPRREPKKRLSSPAPVKTLTSLSAGV
jgi:RNA polymerase sigma factor (sigma-70 family)